MPNSPAGLAHAIGRLEGEIKALKEQLERDRQESQISHETTRQYQKDLRDVLGALSGCVQELTRQVNEAKPLWKDYEEKRAEARGAAKLVKLLYATIAAIFGAAGAFAVEWLRAAGR